MVNYKCPECHGTGKSVTGETCEYCQGSGEKQAEELPPDLEQFGNRGSQ